MVRNHYKRISAWVMALFMLTGCAFQPAPDTTAYDDGYSAGYMDGENAGKKAATEEAYDSGYASGFAAGTAEKEPPADTTSKPDGQQYPAEFVLISDVIPDAILEIRYYSTYNFVGERIDGYDAPVALLTREAAEALKAVSDELAQQGYRLKIYDAYRPQCAVDHFKAWAKDLDDTRMKPYFYPEVPKEELFDRGYIASRSGHSRGSTVDLTLFDMRTGKDVDMGGTFDYFGAVSHAAYTDTLTQQQIEHRKLLKDAMLAHGFKGISTEWWHFTLKNEPYPDTYFDFHVTDRPA